MEVRLHLRAHFHLALKQPVSCLLVNFPRPRRVQGLCISSGNKRLQAMFQVLASGRSRSPFLTFWSFAFFVFSFGSFSPELPLIPSRMIAWTVGAKPVPGERGSVQILSIHGGSPVHRHMWELGERTLLIHACLNRLCPFSRAGACTKMTQQGGRAWNGSHHGKWTHVPCSAHDALWLMGRGASSPGV